MHSESSKDYGNKLSNIVLHSYTASSQSHKMKAHVQKLCEFYSRWFCLHNGHDALKLHTKEEENSRSHWNCNHPEVGKEWLDQRYSLFLSSVFLIITSSPALHFTASGKVQVESNFKAFFHGVCFFLQIKSNC